MYMDEKHLRNKFEEYVDEFISEVKVIGWTKNGMPENGLVMDLYHTTVWLKTWFAFKRGYQCRDEKE